MMFGGVAGLAVVLASAAVGAAAAIAAATVLFRKDLRLFELLDMKWPLPIKFRSELQLS